MRAFHTQEMIALSDEVVANSVKEFIFKHIDSIELLEALLHLRAHADIFLTAKNISDHLRANPMSVSNRLQYLVHLGIVQQNEQDSQEYRYAPKDAVVAQIIDDLAENYRTRRHRIYELVFSPLKKMNSFADSFLVRIHNKKSEDDNG